ncbi:MAG TPA: hypothetical protein RMG95_13655, partial [Polyangiaceae bacterium LLY-WYZ-15_(1-7)]|nr:hypothetical protein [Polyangiaceae bacterium LLY-WYZ-15_(1-7)]
LATLRERRELLEVAAERWRDPRLARDARLLARYERVVDRAWAGFGPDGQRELLLAMGWFGDRRMR